MLPSILTKNERNCNPIKYAKLLTKIVVANFREGISPKPRNICDHFDKPMNITDLSFTYFEAGIVRGLKLINCDLFLYSFRNLIKEFAG